MVRVMRYGFYLPTRGQTATPEALETLVKRGENLGFASVMIADHLVFPVTIKSRYPYTVSGDFPGKGDVLDQLSLMAFVAAKTTRLRLVTSVMIVPYRNPVLTAKALATIDVLSKGRVTLGVGVGWMREEFEALGTPDFDRRGAVTDEYLRIFKTLWTESPASFSGRFYRFGPLTCSPHPVQKPHPPIWVGDTAKRRRAGRPASATAGTRWAPTRPSPCRRPSCARSLTNCIASSRLKGAIHRRSPSPTRRRSTTSASSSSGRAGSVDRSRGAPRRSGTTSRPTLGSV